MGLWGRGTVHTLASVEETVRSLIERLHITFPSSVPRRLATAERDDAIRDRYAGGLSIPKIARDYRLSRARIHQVLHRRHR
jgi:Mor family transcriptional regulator